MAVPMRLQRGERWLRRQSEILHLLAIGAPRERILAELDTWLQAELAGAALALAVQVDGESFRWHGTGAVAAVLAAELDAEGLGEAEGRRTAGGATSSPTEYWVEPLHDVGGRRIGQLLIAAADDAVAAQPPNRVGATIAELVFQRDAAVARLEHGRELYRSLLDNHPDAVLHVGADGHVRSANSPARQLFGRELDVPDGAAFAALFDETSQAALALRLPSVLRGNAQSM
ncbi:MAG TPA: PAS domain-containing protein, partial [Tahibacter sp.]|nr:PAS domain-containing protein [Tahibacter sp.]